MSFESNYENAQKVFHATRKVAKSYIEVHFWELPKEETFTTKLCTQLNMEPTEKNVLKIIKIVNEWNIHKALKGIYKGTFIPLERK